MHRIASVEALSGYRLRIVFADGLEGTVDLSDMVGEGVFEALKDSDEFAKAFVDPVTHTIAWPGGIDLCPDALYREIAEQRRAA